MDPFVPVKDGGQLITILQSRLPISASIYNMAKMHARFPNEMRFYTIFGDMSPSCWIFATYIRDDFGLDMQISVPEGAEWTPELEEAFVDTKVIDWDKPYLFTAIREDISHRLIQINTQRKGNAVRIHPNWAHFMDLEVAKGLSYEVPQGVEIRPLEGSIGKDFLYNNWSYSTKGTEVFVDQMVEKNETAAVYVEGVPVSGLTLSSNGFMALLNTIKSHRGKGYGTVCTKDLMRRMALNGFYPCSTVAHRNVKSLSLHAKHLGMSITHEVNYISHQGSMIK